MKKQQYDYTIELSVNNNKFNSSLPPGYLQLVDELSPEEALLRFTKCPIPPDRIDLKYLENKTTETYIKQQIKVVQLKHQQNSHLFKELNLDDLLIIGAFTLESSIYKLLNGWGNTKNRSVNEMIHVSPYLRLLLESLRRLPPRFHYEGFGVRVLSTNVPILKLAFDNYKEHFARGKEVNFHSVSSWGKDENLLKEFMENPQSPEVIILKCDNIMGYLIEEISMMPQEGEIIVEGPSFFRVLKQPIKVYNSIIVEIEYDFEKSEIMSYLPDPNKGKDPKDQEINRLKQEIQRLKQENIQIGERFEKEIERLKTEIGQKEQEKKQIEGSFEQEKKQIEIKLRFQIEERFEKEIERLKKKLK